MTSRPPIVRYEVAPESHYDQFRGLIVQEAISATVTPRPKLAPRRPERGRRARHERYSGSGSPDQVDI